MIDFLGRRVLDSCNRISIKMQIGFDYDCMVGTAAKGLCLSMISTCPISCWKTLAWLQVLKLCPKLFRVKHIQNLQFQDWIKHFQSHSSKSRTPKQQQLIFICGLPSWTVDHDNWFRLHIHLLKSLNGWKVCPKTPNVKPRSDLSHICRYSITYHRINWCQCSWHYVFSLNINVEFQQIVLMMLKEHIRSADRIYYLLFCIIITYTVKIHIFSFSSTKFCHIVIWK